MLYNKEELPNYVRTAGKITIATALAGFMVFIVAFVFDFGTQELSKVSAQGQASTTLTVLNTPPQFDTNAYEVIESSTSSPTNSGDVIQWSALGSDSNGAPYFLLICDSSATPTADHLNIGDGTGIGEPACDVGATQWGVSASTTSGTLATVSTTTFEAAPFGELNDWYAWVCDDDAVNPRCNDTPVQGLSATNTSPFHMNSRPTFTANLINNGPVDPGGQLVFNSTSTDGDIVGGSDDIILIVCNSNSNYSTTTNNCSDLISSTTVSTTDNAGSTSTLNAILPDDVYPAYGYIVDEHGHEAATNPLQANFTVNNVAPVVLGGDINLNGGGNISLTQPAAETTGFTLDFTISDQNSCWATGSTSELSGYGVSVFRSGVGTTTCNGNSASYDANNCYPGGVVGVATTTWDLDCSIVSSCPDDASSADIDYSCTFPLWFIADATDDGAVTSPYATENWSAGVYGLDNNSASGTMATTSSNSVELVSFPAIDSLANDIAYGAVEPGNDTGAVNASSTIVNVGNTGLDQETQGESMCGTYTLLTECPVSASSTIPAYEQEFSSTTFAYGAGTSLSSSSAAHLELDVMKTTGTSSSEYQTGTTYWGINVPALITLAGSYTGLNTFTAAVAETVDW